MRREHPGEQVGADVREHGGEGARGLVAVQRRPGAARRRPPRPPRARSAGSVTPVSRSPQRMADAIGDGPRWRGSSEGCTFTPPRGKRSRNGCRKIRPKATTTSSSGASSRTVSRTSASRRSTSSTRRPSARAARLTSDASGRPAPARGLVPRREHGADLVGPGRRPQRGHGDAGGSREEDAHQSRSFVVVGGEQAFAPLRVEPVDEEDAVQVVQLVLDHPGEHAVGREGEGPALLVPGLHAHRRRGAPSRCTARARSGSPPRGSPLRGRSRGCRG